MKFALCLLVLASYLSGMDSPDAAEQLKARQALEQAGRIKVYEGPDHAWHLANSFIQAVICPANVIYTSERMEFPHYKRSYITFHAMYTHATEWLDIMQEKPYEEVMARAEQIINLYKPFEHISEFHKFLIAKSWLYGYLQQEDAPSYLIKKDYEAALRDGNYIQLRELAQRLQKNDKMTLNKYIRQKRESAYVIKLRERV